MMVDPGRNNSASRMPKRADANVAPVVGETNLFMHSCCMISPATLIPIPVQRIASNLGKREIRKSSNCSALPANSSPGVISITPTKSERKETTASSSPSAMLRRHECFSSNPTL